MFSVAIQVLLDIYFRLLVVFTGEVQQDNMYSLGSKLFPGAHIFISSSTGLSNPTSTLDAKRPKFDAVIKVATEKDVQQTVSRSDNDR